MKFSWCLVNFLQNIFTLRYRQSLLRDQKTTPLETAIYWTEYVLRHDGAYHLQTPGRHMRWVSHLYFQTQWKRCSPRYLSVSMLYSFMQYYSLDVLCFFFICLWLIKVAITRYVIRTSRALDVKLKVQWCFLWPKQQWYDGIEVWVAFRWSWSEFKL